MLKKTKQNKKTIPLMPSYGRTWDRQKNNIKKQNPPKDKWQPTKYPRIRCLMLLRYFIGAPKQNVAEICVNCRLSRDLTFAAPWRGGRNMCQAKSNNALRTKEKWQINRVKKASLRLSSLNLSVLPYLISAEPVHHTVTESLETLTWEVHGWL